jgi:hypothetical protein
MFPTEFFLTVLFLFVIFTIGVYIGNTLLYTLAGSAGIGICTGFTLGSEWQKKLRDYKEETHDLN